MARFPTLNTLSVIALGLCCFATSVAAETRWHQYHKQFGNPKHPATIKTASLFDAGGSEWLVAADFLDGGSIVLVGNTVGPAFQPEGVTPKIIGRDTGTSEFEATEWKAGKQREPVTDSSGKPMMAPPNADDLNAAPFIAIFRPEGRDLLQAARLPWKTGPVFDAKVDSRGSIYLLGQAGPLIGSLGNIQRLQKTTPEATPKPTDNKKKKKKGKPAADTELYLIKVAASLDRVEWVRTFREPAARPSLMLVNDSRLIVNAHYLSEFDLNGNRQRIVTEWKQGKKQVRAVNPRDGSFAVGGDRNTGTGREPWRKPNLYMLTPDAEVDAELYQWHSGMVGADTLRLLSDSSIRAGVYTPDGRYLWLAGWSDGGNSVMNSQPFDLFTKVKSPGLGMSMWGANVLSASYLMKMNTDTYEVEEKTVWGAYLKDKNKPNSVGVETMATTDDGSLVVAGRSASGLIQTNNNLYSGSDNPAFAPGGPYITIMNPDLRGLRFSSVLSATGEVPHGKHRFGLASGKSNGKNQVIIVSGAVPERKSKYDMEHQSPPTQNAWQTEFGGGATDGHFLVLEMEDLK